MRFAQLVMGPAGSGKSTYCDTIHKHCENIGRNIQVVNLDPAAEHFSYPVTVDIRELVELDDVMEAEDLKLGPNGGLIFCLEYFVKNFEWLQEQLGDGDEDYILFDCPGVLSALSAMIQLEVPHVNVMTKMDLLTKKQMKEIERFLDPDPRTLVDELGDGMNKKFRRLNEAIAQLIEDYSMVCFLPLNSKDEDSIIQLLGQIDMAIQYGEDTDVKTRDFNEPDKEEEDEDQTES